MTRENKIALVVGFALILVVGILVSDHFSVAQSQQSADLLPARDPLSQERHANSGLLRFNAPPRAPLTASDGGRAVQPRRDAGDPAMTVAPPPRSAARAPERRSETTSRVGLDADDVADLPFVYHRIGPGESLSSICKAYYGDESLVKDLAKYNGLDDPDVIVLNQRLRVPAAETLVRGEPAESRRSERRNRPGGETAGAIAAAPAGATAGATATPTTPNVRDPETYTVRSGDVLSVIAQRELGSSRRWSELYELNRDRIKSPNHVTAGTVLRLPPH